MWLGPGQFCGDLERPLLLSRLTCCLLTSSSRDGALRTRTALVEGLRAGGSSLTLRVADPSLEYEVIPNPRVIVSALDPLTHAWLVVNGLARLHAPARTPFDDWVLLEVAVHSMERWSGPPLDEHGAGCTEAAMGAEAATR